MSTQVNGVHAASLICLNVGDVDLNQNGNGPMFCRLSERPTPYPPTAITDSALVNNRITNLFQWDDATFGREGSKYGSRLLCARLCLDLAQLYQMITYTLPLIRTTVRESHRSLRFFQSQQTPVSVLHVISAWNLDVQVRSWISSPGPSALHWKLGYRKHVNDIQ